MHYVWICGLTLGLISVNGSTRAVDGDSELLPRVSANRAALFLSLNPSTAFTAN